MSSNWEVEFFRGIALDFWRRAITPEQTRAEVDFLRESLNASARSHLLDLPCGNGRHSLGLAAGGCRTTGFDLSEEFIAEAREASGSLPVSWVIGDMRRLCFDCLFDGAFSMGNSFCYLDPQEASSFIEALAQTLKPGARFVLETGMAAESILPSLQKTRWFKAGDLFMLSENEYHSREGRLDVQYTFVRDGRTETRPSSSYVLTVSELCRMHVQAGFDPVQLLGSIQGESYRLGSPRLILISERR